MDLDLRHKFVNRSDLQSFVDMGLEDYQVTCLLGARQTGKTTLAQMVIQRYRNSGIPVHLFDLESPLALEALKNPELELTQLTGLVVIDEIQRMPQLFTLLRPLADRNPLPARFLILGSASPHLVKGVSESLAGRVHFVDVGGFSLKEVGNHRWRDLWLRGGYPRSFFASTPKSSFYWRANLIKTFFEQDLPQLGVKIPAIVLKRFFNLLAHYHGQIWNSSPIATTMGLSAPTIAHYRTLLEGSFLIRSLHPFHENLKKRQVKSPKTYFRDSGLLHCLLPLKNPEQLYNHPSYGASFEGFALEQILNLFPEGDPWFWHTIRGAELDLLLLNNGERLGFEFKCADAPKLTPSMKIAHQDLKLDKLYVIYPGDLPYPLTEWAEVVPISQIVERFSLGGN